MTQFLPEGLDEFLAEAGWGGSEIEPLPGDASFRRYFRVRNPASGGENAGRSAMVMDAPPPAEDPRPFLQVGRWLASNGLRAPHIYAERAERGLVLIEDFGSHRLRDWLDRNPQDERAVYAHAVEALVELHRCPPGPFDPYDMATYNREVSLFTQWYCRRLELDVDLPGFESAWTEVLAPLVERQRPGVTVLRDYHAENIMLPHPEQPGGGEQGLIDFQDALVGHPAYDLVSLLQDARRDVSPELERDMLALYAEKASPAPEFAADYARLGAQRNAKIVGIFSRLAMRDEKPRYLPLIPRVWKAMESDLAHPALAPVARWFDANIPAGLRASHGERQA